MPTTRALERQEDFYNMLDRYNGGIEPLENWETEDLVRLSVLIDIEIQNREHNARKAETD